MAAPSPKSIGIIEHYFGLNPADAEPVLDRFAEQQLAGGDWLFHQGDSGDSLYFLTRGRLQVWIEAGDESRMVGELESGACVGEIGLLTAERRSAGIRAVRDCQLLRLDRDDFEQLVHAHPRLAIQLAGAVASRLQHRTSGQQRASRQSRTVAVIQIRETPAGTTFCRDLVEHLQRGHEVLHLAPQTLAASGAPDATLSENCRRWISDQEDRYRFTVFDCADRAAEWARYAERQADVVLWVAEAGDQLARTAAQNDLGEWSAHALGMQLLVLLQPAQADSVAGTAAWLDAMPNDRHLHVRAGSGEDVGRVARVVDGTAVGLVLGGGAARGFAELGAYKALLELGIPVDWIGGTSIGSIMGAAIASGWGPDRAIELAREAFVEGRPFSDFTLPVVSLLSGKRMERLLEHHLGGQIEDLLLPYFCISSNLGRGVKNVHSRGPIADACRASASMPGIFPPAVVDGELTVDGAVLDNLPVDEMRACPVGPVIAVDVSSRLKQSVEFEHVPSAGAILRGRYLPVFQKQHVPSLMTVMLKSTEIGTLQQVRAQGDAADLLLNPPVRHFGMTDVKSFDRIVEAGYQHSLEKAGAWWSARAQQGS